MQQKPPFRRDCGKNLLFIYRIKLEMRYLYNGLTVFGVMQGWLNNTGAVQRENIILPKLKKKNVDE